MATAQACRILRIRLNVADLDAAVRFYAEALGFERLPPEAATDVVAMRLGEQEIELALATGASYPEPRAANDPWFQHFAIAVSDMEPAYRRLLASGAQPISAGGPQRLPPSTGSVTAYKFRDPEGHPLELSHIPNSAWNAPKASGPFLGVDHTAIAVEDLEVSVAFYAEVLGFRAGARFLNTGPEQDRLDGLDGVVLDIVSLESAAGGPHIELLHYRSPAPHAPRRNLVSKDVAATRLVVERHDLPAAAEAMAERGIRALHGPDGGLEIVDPDGHHLTLVDRPSRTPLRGRA